MACRTAVTLEGLAGKSFRVTGGASGIALATVCRPLAKSDRRFLGGSTDSYNGAAIIAPADEIATSDPIHFDRQADDQQRAGAWDRWGCVERRVIAGVECE